MSVDLDELDRLEKTATPGPWAGFRGGVSSQDPGAIARQREHDKTFALGLRLEEDPDAYADKSASLYGGALVAESMSTADGALVAALRNAWPELRERLRTAEAIVDWTLQNTGTEEEWERFNANLGAYRAARKP